MPKKKNKGKICIIDDEPMILEMYQERLKKEGYQVITATDGISGFNIIKKNKPNLALIDIIMKKKDGISLIKELKKNKELKCIPIIILTNLDDQNVRKKACQLGVLFYLIKPNFLPSQIAEIVNEILSVKAKHAEILNMKKCKK